MKSILRILLVVFVFSAAAQAQFSIGLKAGMNYSTLSVDGDADYGYTPGFQVGAFVDYNLPRVSFQMDVAYSKQGASIKSGGEEMEAVAKYVNLPITVKYKFNQSINVQLGPQIGFLTCMESDYHPVVDQPFQEQDYTKAYKKTDFGLNIGAGWESTSGLMIDLKYYLGLADISNYEGVESTKNSMMQLTVGYKIFKFK